MRTPLAKVCTLVAVASIHIASYSRGSDLVDCPKELSSALRDALDNPRPLAGLLQTIFDTASGVVERSSPRRLFNLPPNESKEVVQMSCVVVSPEEMQRLGYKGRIVLRIICDSVSDKALKVLTIAELTGGRTVPDVAAGFPVDWVVGRVLQTRKVAQARKEKRPIEQINLSFGPISWPSNPIRGHGFIMRIEFGGVQTGVSDEDSPSFAAFSAMYPFDGAPVKARLKGASAEDELLDVEMPTSLKESPGILEF